MKKTLDIHTIQVRAAEDAIIDSLPGLLGISREEFERRMNAPYRWPVNSKGVPYPQGNCSFCRQIDKKHPNGAACDFSCVGV